MDVLSSRILLRPGDLDRSRRFYRDLLGLAVYREFGPPDDPGLVFFLGQGLLEVSGHAAGPLGNSVMIWIQVRDVHAEHARLAAAGVPIMREPAAEPWGLIEMWIEDPDGVRIVLVEVPADHPLRRDPRPALPPRPRTRMPHNKRPPQTRGFPVRAGCQVLCGLSHCLACWAGGLCRDFIQLPAGCFREVGSDLVSEQHEREPGEARRVGAIQILDRLHR